MPLPLDEREFLAHVEHPDHATCVAKANEFCALTGLSSAQFAEELRREYGRCGRSTILFYLRGDYARHSGTGATTFMDARVWDFVTRHWPKTAASGATPEAVLETRGYRQILECFNDAREGVNSLIYGPPAAEKSFVLENLALQHPGDSLYVECSPEMSKLALLRRTAMAAGIFLSRAWMREQYTEAIISAFASRPAPPILIFDEAQLLPLSTLEEIRILHNRTRRRERPGCGVILAGSHNLYQNFMRADRRVRMEQWLSRLPNRVQLEGMSRDEALEIAATAWNSTPGRRATGKRAKFTPEIEERILASCEVADPYATDPDGRPLMKDGKPVLRTYYSPRRLLHFIRQQKKNLRRVVAEPANEGVA